MSDGIHRADALTCRKARRCCVLPSILSAAAALLLTAAPIVDQARAEALVVQGSTTLAERLIVPKQQQIEALSGQSLKVVPTRSDVGILRLFFGGSELAMISTSLANEIAFLRRDYPDLPYDRLRGFAIGRARVAFAVNPTNPVRDVDAARLRRILSGEITNWRQVGGANLPVRVVFVAGGDGVTLSVARTVLDDSSVNAPDSIRVQKPIQVIQVVQQEAGALGIAQLRLAQEHQLHDVASVAPVEQELNLVTLGEPTPTERAVIEAAQRTAASAR
jgi:phosphate transport system substrate-binding protein